MRRETMPPAQTEAQSTFPLSYNQTRITFHQLMHPQSSAYNMVFRYHIRGPLHLEKLKQSIVSAVQHLPALHTRFVPGEQELLQMIRPEQPIPLEHLDFSGLPDPVLAWKAYCEGQAKEAFDLFAGPLYRLTTCTLGPEHTGLLINIHHSIADGQSIGMLCQRMSTLYQDRPMQDPAPGNLEFAEWQRQNLHGPRLERKLDHFKQLLKDSSPVQWPLDLPQPDHGLHRAALLLPAFPLHLQEALGRLASLHQSTLFHVLLTTFCILLHRYTGQASVVLGVPTGGRHLRPFEHAVANLVNPVVVHSQCSAGMSFSQLLQQLRAQLLLTLYHQDLPFEKLVEVLKPQRRQLSNPLFQIMFSFQQETAKALELPGCTCSFEEVPVGHAKMDLNVTFTETPQGLQGSIEYDADLFMEASMEQLVETYMLLLESVVQTPDLPIEHLPLCSTTGPALKGDVFTRPLDDLLDRVLLQLRRDPSKTAVVDEHHQLTRGEVEQLMHQYSLGLQHLKVTGGSIVGICLKRQAHLVPLLLACLYTGSTYVPIDPQYPQQRIRHMVEDSGMHLLITDEVQEGMPCQQVTLKDLQRPKDGPLPPVSDPQQHPVMYLIYTSGSTGVPKGVLVTRQGVMNLLSSMQSHLNLHDGDCCLGLTTISFDIAVLEIFLPLMAGARLVLASEHHQHQPQELARWISAHNITFMQATPVSWRMLLSVGFQGSSELKILCGGEKLDGPLASGLLNRCASLWNVYGPTETTIWSTIEKVENNRSNQVFLGHPLHHTSVFVLDGHQHRLPQGAIGEIVLGGAGVAVGYHNRPELTDERFITLPGVDGRVYRTGDLGRVHPSGKLSYLGRNDMQVKVRGQRIEVGEIEATLLSCPVVRDAAVVLSHREIGDELLAYVAIDPNQKSEDATHLQNHWTALWDHSYQESHSSNPTLNTAGWISRIDQQPLAPEVMADWASRTTQKLLSLPHGHVLELGFGTGMILQRLLPHAEKYVASDPSSTAVERLEGLIGRQVEVHCLDALHTLQQLQGERFDCIVLNSVVQYFPDVRYLEEVIRMAENCLASQGCIFLGDVISMQAAREIHWQRLLQQDPQCHESSLELVMQEEQELWIDPAYFAKHLERFNVQLTLKSHMHDNEISRYRYDVVLSQRGKSLDLVCAEHTLQHWDDVDGLLSGNSVPCAITLPSPHLHGTSQRAMEVLDMLGAQGLEAHLLVRSCDLQQVQLLILDPEKHSREQRAAECSRRSAEQLLGGGGHTDPMFSHQAALVTAELFALVKERLPEIMVPQRLIVLKTLPKTPNQKIDRKALPLPPAVRNRATLSQTMPSNPLEQSIIEVWENLLGCAGLNREDSFFEVGGHSLLALQAMLELGQKCGFELPLEWIFTHDTPALLSVKIQQEQNLVCPSHQAALQSPIQA